MEFVLNMTAMGLITVVTVLAAAVVLVNASGRTRNIPVSEGLRTMLQALLVVAYVIAFTVAYRDVSSTVLPLGALLTFVRLASLSDTLKWVDHEPVIRGPKVLALMYLSNIVLVAGQGALFLTVLVLGG